MVLKLLACLDSIQLVALLKEEFRQMAAVLPRDRNNQSSFGREGGHGGDGDVVVC